MLLWKLTANNKTVSKLDYILATFVCILHKQPKLAFPFSEHGVWWSRFLWDLKISKTIHRKQTQKKELWSGLYGSFCLNLPPSIVEEQNIENSIKPVYTSTGVISNVEEAEAYTNSYPQDIYFVHLCEFIPALTLF